MATWISLAEYARMRGVSRQAAHGWHRRGVLVTRPDVRRPGRLEVNVEASDALRGEKQNPVKRQAEAPTTGVQGDDAEPEAEGVTAEAVAPAARDEARDAASRARVERETYSAANARLDYEARIGRLVDRQEVERRQYGVMRAMRDRLLMIPAKLHADDRQERQRLDEEIRAVLMDLAGEFEQAGEADGHTRA